MNGTYKGYTFPAGAQVVYHYDYFMPLRSITQPFESNINEYKSCSLTVPSHNSTAAPCVCQSRGIYVCVDCTRVKLSNGDPSALYYPEIGPSCYY